MHALRTRNPLLAILLTTSTVVTGALVWFGVRNLEQTKSLERQQAREQLERGADAFAAGVRGKLAEAGERLSGSVSTTNSPLVGLDDAVTVVVTEGRIQVVPPGALPFVPGDVRIESSDKLFAEAETIELAGNKPELAAGMYSALSRNHDPHIRAEALLRLGRVQRKERKLEEAAETYQSLAQMGNVIVGGLPAADAGLGREAQALKRRSEPPAHTCARCSEAHSAASVAGPSLLNPVLHFGGSSIPKT